MRPLQVIIITETSMISSIIIPKIGEPPGTRTQNLKVKSLLLCRLS